MGKNHLNKEKSPYLLQHKDNPVWWHPWDEEAFKRAKAENKPIFLSIGYSTCHWCHVMEKESFEDPTVAEVLNQHFVSIKVDREERPDVDAIYMSSVLAISGHGGWPMSVWLTPDGRPFFGATYFPRDRFISLLNRIAEVWQSDQSAVEKDAEKLLQAISITHSPSKSEEPQWMSTILDRFVERLRSSFDSTRGGFGSAPKFPQSLSLMALMRLNVSRKNKSIDEVVRKTLDGMCRGGMYDHLVGGFHRYSVDEKWLVPHFEKMLYDNALLAQTYTEAYQYFGDEEYALVAKEILDYILAEMTSPSGGFFSAQDADSLSPETNEKEEGYFATYDYETLQSILTTEELNEVCRVYGACREGHFEGRNILHLQPSFQRKNISDRPVLSLALTKLRQLRRSRFSPHLDDKVVSAWNGWTITAMVKAASCFSSPSATASPSHYLQAAIRAGEFIWQELFRNNTLHRRWRDGEARFTAYSDDYAAVINGYLHLFQATGDEKWYTRSLTLQTILDAQYWDRKSGGYFRDSGQDKTLIVRLKEDHDGVRPNANSLAATNLLWLYALTLDNNYLEKAQAIFDYYQPILTDYPTNLPQMVTALDLYLHKPQQVVIVEAKEGEGEDFLKAFNQKFSPNAFIVKITADNPSIPLTQDKTLRGNKTTYYVCQGSHCQAPTNDAMEALNQINIV